MALQILAILEGLLSFWFVFRFRLSLVPYPLFVLFLSVDATRNIIQGNPATLEYGARWVNNEPLGLVVMLLAVCESTVSEAREHHSPLWLIAGAAFALCMVPWLASMLEWQAAVQWHYKRIGWWMWCHQMAYASSAAWLTACAVFRRGEFHRTTCFLAIMLGTDSVLFLFGNCRLLNGIVQNILLYVIPMAMMLYWPGFILRTVTDPSERTTQT